MHKLIGLLCSSIILLDPILLASILLLPLVHVVCSWMSLITPTYVLYLFVLLLRSNSWHFHVRDDDTDIRGQDDDSRVNCFDSAEVGSHRGQRRQVKSKREQPA